MKKIAWLFCFVSCSALAQVIQPSGPISPSQVTFPDGSMMVSAAYRTPGLYISPYCPVGNSTCIKIFGDGLQEVDCTTNGTTTVTCPAGLFTNADIGKVFWATTNGAAAILGKYVSTTFLCGQTTIASVTNATTVVLTAGCSGSNAGASVVYWGHDDGAALAAISPNCNVIHVSAGSTTSTAANVTGNFIFTGQPFLDTIPNCSQNSLAQTMGQPAPSLIADGFGASQTTFEMTPNFAWTNCPAVSGASQKVCIGGGMRVLANIGIHASGLTSAANANCPSSPSYIVASAWPYSSVAYGVVVSGVCPGSPGTGYEDNSADGTFDLGGVQDSMTYACGFYGQKGESMRGGYCSNADVSGGQAIYMSGGADMYTFSDIPIKGGFLLTGNSTMTSVRTQYIAGGGQNSEVQSGSQFNSYSDTFTNILTIDSGAKHFTTNTSYAQLSNAGSVYSGGNNSNTIIGGGSGVWSGGGMIYGDCQGTATSSISTSIALYGAGQLVDHACTHSQATTTLGGVKQAVGGTVSYLVCAATHAGVSASSGVVTVYKSHLGTSAATALTCTIGTGTSCFDVTHTDTAVAGDAYWIGFTTQATEVLAGVSCVLQPQASW